MDEERLYLGCILGRAGTVIALREKPEGFYYVLTVHLDAVHTFEASHKGKTMYDVYEIAEFQDDKAVATHIVVDTDYAAALKAYLQGGDYHD